MTGDATESAINALAHRVYERDHTDPESRGSTIDFAFEFLTWLRAQGWTHAPAAPPPPPARNGLRGIDLARAALAQRGKGDTDGR